jgi:transposase
MGPKSNQDRLLKKFEDEKRRGFMLDLHGAGKSLNYIVKEVENVFKQRIAKSTVQYVIKRFKNRSTLAAKNSPGRKSKMTKQYAPFCDF